VSNILATKQAKTFSPEQLTKLLRFIDRNSKMPARDKLIVLLSFKAGLRVSEIAKIDLTAMTDVEGNINRVIRIFTTVGKKERSREIPMHRDIHDALIEFRRVFRDAEFVAISSQPFRYKEPNAPYDPSLYRRMSVNALTVYYHQLLDEAGFEGASSHSGRRTFGTELARRANNYHNSLLDVQNLLGHARLDTTQRYLEPSKNTSDMVNSL
jgi:integrase/recombinase XerD